MKYVLALAFLSGAVCAAPDTVAAGFAAPAPGDRLTAGRTALASFELPRGPSRVEEMELVLSLDGGATFPLRLSGELPPGTRRAGWRVPALPGVQAVLALRAGDSDGNERILLVSGRFTILGSADAQPDDIRFSHGEWRTREAGFEGVLPPGDGSFSGGREERFAALASEVDLGGCSAPRLLSFPRRSTVLPPAGRDPSTPEFLSQSPPNPVSFPRRE